MTPADILFGPTLLFDVVPVFCGRPPFPRRDPSLRWSTRPLPGVSGALHLTSASRTSRKSAVYRRGARSCCQSASQAAWSRTTRPPT
jgi:hypothetical protein